MTSIQQPKQISNHLLTGATATIAPAGGNRAIKPKEPRRDVMPPPSPTGVRMTMAQPTQTGLMDRPKTMNAASSALVPDARMTVQGQLEGLLDPNSAAMRKQIANANNYSAGRGLQSSSIATGAAMDSMLNFATPIAQQDAQTYANRYAQESDQAFQSGQNALNREHETTMQQSDQRFKSGESALDRAQQTELENLRYQNESGLLTQQGKQRMEELESQQNFQMDLEDKRYSNESGLLDKRQEFEAGENAANRQQQTELEKLRYRNESGLLDQQGQQRLEELEKQQNFQSGENDANRQLQERLQQLDAEARRGDIGLQGQLQMDQLKEQIAANQQLEVLRNQNALGQLDKQGQIQMQQMEKQAEIQTARDTLLQGFQQNNMALQHANQMIQLEKQIKAEFDKMTATQKWQTSMQNSQNAFAAKMELGNSVSAAINNSMAAMGAAYQNPEMNGTQQRAAVNQINQNLTAQIDKLKLMYGMDDSAAGGGGSTGGGTGGGSTGGGSTGGGGGGNSGGRGGNDGGNGGNVDLPPYKVQ